MIIEIFEMMGLNASLFVDVIGAVAVFLLIVLLMTFSVLKGVAWPMLRAKIRKENIAFIDVGGIETPIVNFPRGAVELSYQHKDNIYSWPIPNGIERMLPNDVRYILAARGMGMAFNASIVTEEISKVRTLLSPKAQANTIDDRAKQIADKYSANVNKPLMMATGVAILFIVGMFGYLIFMKAMEYDLAQQYISEAARAAVQVTTTTLQQLPPLD